VLILARAPGHAVRIGTEITVTVLGVRGRTVRLGIDAPSTVAVYREELYRRLTAANRVAASTPVTAVAAGAAALGSRAVRAPAARQRRSSCESSSAL
jgi:carbon storage regulator